jgi:tRNA(Ile)-lysidine synthase
MFLKKLREFIKRENLLQRGQRIVLAVSGGIDSVALLYSFLELSHDFKLDIHVAHLDHGIRETSQRDARFVQNLCEKLGVGFTIKRVKIEKKTGVTLEEIARRVRYEFLMEVKKSVKADLIATAHHKDDLAETLLHRIIRGTGVRGLVGMKPKQGDIIRPFLIFTRKEIEDFAKQMNLDYVVDETNFDVTYTRNFIRHKLIPLMKEVNPSLSDSMYRLSRNAERLMSFLEYMLESVMKKVKKLHFGYEIPGDIHDYLKSELIRKITEEKTGKLPSYLDIERSISTSEHSKKVVFWDDFGVWGSFGKTFVGYLNRPQIEYKLNTGEYDFWDYKVVVEKGTGIKKSEGMVLRNRRKGDKIGSKKLKDLMIDMRIPAYLRDEIPLIAIGREVIWMGGKLLREDYKGEGFSVVVLGGDKI